MFVKYSMQRKDARKRYEQRVKSQLEQSWFDPQSYHQRRLQGMRVTGNESGGTFISDRRTATGLEERRRLLSETNFSPFTTEVSSANMIEQLDKVDDLPKPKLPINTAS